MARNPKPPPDPPLPEIPREWLMELLDTLREFGSCPTCKRVECKCP